MKIAIFGRPGSGKTTFSYDLHLKTNLPLHHLDKYFFESNWNQRDKQEFLAIQQQLVDQEGWIIDGNSISSLEMRWAKADIVLYFRRNKLRCLLGLFQRFFTQRDHIDDRAPNCPERVSLDLIHYLWTLDQRVHPYITTLRQKYPNAMFFEVQTKRDLDKAERMCLGKKI